MANIEDQHYINLIRNGNQNAFTVLVDRYKNLVFTLALKMLNNREEAEEIAQDTFVKVYNSLNNFKGDSKFSTWIYKVTYNTCLDRLKKNKKEKTVSYLDDFSEHQAKAIEIVLDSIDENERNKAIQDCLKELPSEDAFLLTLYYFDGKSVDEISKVINVSVDNVKVRLFRVRKKTAVIFKERLEPELLDYYENGRR
jgi:RNA polymerase sigma factor (sigma-70 family)